MESTLQYLKLHSINGNTFKSIGGIHDINDSCHIVLKFTFRAVWHIIAKNIQSYEIFWHGLLNMVRVHARKDNHDRIANNSKTFF